MLSCCRLTPLVLGYSAPIWLGAVATSTRTHSSLFSSAKCTGRNSEITSIFVLACSLSFGAYFSQVRAKRQVSPRIDRTQQCSNHALFVISAFRDLLAGILKNERLSIGMSPCSMSSSVRRKNLVSALTSLLDMKAPRDSNVHCIFERDTVLLAALIRSATFSNS